MIVIYHAPMVRSFFFLLQSQTPIDSLHYCNDERLPSDEISDPVQQISVQQMRFVPRIGEHPLEIDFFLAEGANLLFPDDAPPSYAKLVECVPAGQSERPEDMDF